LVIKHSSISQVWNIGVQLKNCDSVSHRFSSMEWNLFTPSKTTYILAKRILRSQIFTAWWFKLELNTRRSGIVWSNFLCWDIPCISINPCQLVLMNKTFYYAEQKNMVQAPTLLVINIHGHCPTVARYRNRLQYDKINIFRCIGRLNPNLHTHTESHTHKYTYRYVRLGSILLWLLVL